MNNEKCKVGTIGFLTAIIVVLLTAILAFGSVVDGNLKQDIKEVDRKVESQKILLDERINDIDRKLNRILGYLEAKE